MKRSLGAKFSIAVLVVLGVMLLSSTASAFDGKRKGFFFSFGMGPGFTSYKQTTDTSGFESYSIDESKVSAFTNFNIGYAPSEQLMIYWMNKVAWFSLEDSTISLDAQTYASSVGGLGLTYYMSPEVPSLYLSIGAGLAARTMPFKGDNPWTGFGVAGGIGYEISKNWNIELSFLYAKTTDDFPEIKEEYTGDAFAFGLSINVMPY